MQLLRYTFIFLSATFFLTSCEDIDAPISEQPDPITSSYDYLFTSDSNGRFDIWACQNGDFSVFTFEESKDHWWARYNEATEQILYYSSNQGREVNDYSTASLNLMNKDGSGHKTLIASGDYEFQAQGLAQWSNDGSRIVFSAKDSTGFWQLYLFEPATELLIPLNVNKDQDYLDPSFSRDDQSIFFIASHNGSKDVNTYEVFEFDLNTENIQRLTFNQTRDHHPTQHVNGHEIWFESLTEPDYLSIGKWQIKKLDLASSDETIAIEGNEILLLPSFHPNGNTVFVTKLNVAEFNMEPYSYEIDSEELIELKSVGANSMNVVAF